MSPNGNKFTALDERQEAYLEWLLCPQRLRKPPTQEAYAKDVGVDTTTLRRWQKRPAFASQWKKRVEELQGSPERTQTLLDNLYERAMDGDTKSAQLYLQATNRLSPQQVNVTTTTTTSELSDSELDDLLKSLVVNEKSERNLKAV
jgi:hypothetical protein